MPQNQADRAYGKSMQLFSVAGGDLVTTVQDVAIDHGISTFDATCLRDPVTTNRKKREDFAISFTLAYERNQGAITTLIDYVGEEVFFSILTASNGQSYSGQGLLEKSSHQIPDGGQTISFNIIPSGVPMTH